MGFPKIKMRLGLILAVAFLRATSMGQSSESPIPDNTMLMQMHLPILNPDHGWVSIANVPVLLQRGNWPQNVVDGMSAPVFANSPIEEERRIDLNLISLAKIGLSARGQAGNEPVDFTIDLSKAEMPKNSRLGLKDVVNSILLCLRLLYPPESPKGINVVITGVANHSDWEKFEGPLWVGVPE